MYMLIQQYKVQYVHLHVRECANTGVNPCKYNTEWKWCEKYLVLS